MLFFLRKLIEAIFLPLGFGTILVLAGLAFRRRWCALLGIVLIVVASVPRVGAMLLLPLEKAWPDRSISSSPTADAVVMLSGGIIRGISAEGIQWSDTVNRFFTAVDLKLAGKAPLLILTDGHDAEHPNLTYSDLLRAEAIRRGVPPDQIVMTGRVLTTEDEARAVARLPGIHRILLVTSAFHMPRSKMLFSAFGFDVEPFPADQHRFSNRRPEPQDLLPIAQGYRETEIALREYYGLAAYWLLFKLHPPAVPGVSPSAPAALSSPQ